VATIILGAFYARVIAGIFVIIDEAVQELFLIITRQESWLSVIVSALAISALFEPLKDRIQRFVDRRIFGEGGGTKKSLANISE
jgi:hypothetical protein